MSRICPVSPESLITIESRGGPGLIQEAYDANHKGPVSVYLKKVDDASAPNNAAGPGWFKIWESVFDPEQNKWGSEKLIDAHGKLPMRLPWGIEAGDYLMRIEMLALHAAVSGDPQPFVGCAQIFVPQGGNIKPPTVEIGEGFYKSDMPAMRFNLYDKSKNAAPFQMPGPDVFKADPTKTVELGQTINQTKGLRPSDVLMEFDNWFTTQLQTYDNLEGWQGVTQDCWQKVRDCWAHESPMEQPKNDHCNKLHDYCQNMDNQFNAGNHNGPPDAGKDITPTATAGVDPHQPLLSRRELRMHQARHHHF